MNREFLRSLAFSLIACLTATLLTIGGTQAGQSVREAHDHDNFSIREEMVPMRDGVKLYTLILSPKQADRRLPILLQRTPYDATRAISGHPSARMEVVLGTKFLGSDYIYAIQDIRGRFKSEGQYVMYRPPRGEFNTTDTDETTDAWDSIDWLEKHVPSNGRVGVWGTSYPGWLTLAAMRQPHPALAAAVPLNPVVDVYPDDDPDFEMWGYQLMISGDIFRGRYRESYEEPRPIEPGQPLKYTIPLPHVNHTFRPGHRLMIQIQSTWFPLYDRNPQTFVSSIMSAPSGTYQSQRHRVYHDKEHATHLELLVDRTGG